MTASDPSQPTMLILGAGYSGKAVARRLLRAGWRVRGTSRTADGARALCEAGLDGFVANAETLSPAMATGATALLASAPPTDQGDPVLPRLETLPADAWRTLHWIGYLSTTGVYGDAGGAWVDETTRPNPANDRGRRRLIAETQWFEFGAKLGVPTHVFRLPGIYGTGRSALDDVRAGKARRIDKPGQVFSRIHVDDIARTVLASLERPRHGAIYNVADDEPAPSAEVVAHACKLLGVEPPPLVAYETIAAELSPMGREFYATNRRIANGLIKRELGVRLAYPTYREGLQAILESETPVR